MSIKKHKQFRGRYVPRESVDEDNRVYRQEPEPPTKIRAIGGRRPTVQKMRILKKIVARGR